MGNRKKEYVREGDTVLPVLEIEIAKPSMRFWWFVTGVLIAGLVGTGVLFMFTDEVVKLRCERVASGSKVCATLEAPSAAEESTAETAEAQPISFTNSLETTLLPRESDFSLPVKLYAPVEHRGVVTTYTTLLDSGGKNAFGAWGIKTPGTRVLADYVGEDGVVLIYNVTVIIESATKSYADWPAGMTENEVVALADGGTFRKKHVIA